MMFEYNLCGKWLELFKEIAPTVKNVAVLRDPSFAPGIGQFAVIEATAPSVGIEVSPIDLPSQAGLNRRSHFAQSPNGGLILTASGIGAANVNLVIAAAARHRLPTVYIQRPFVVAGGLICINRILRISIAARQATLTAFCGAQNPVIFRRRHQPGTNSPST